MTCYFGIDENEDLSMFWDEYPEPKRDAIPIIFPDVDRSDEGWETKQDEYHCWQGSRLPQWM
jgi:hypothetical protein